MNTRTDFLFSILSAFLLYFSGLINAQGPLGVLATIGSQAALGAEGNLNTKLTPAKQQVNGVLTSPGITNAKFVRAPPKGGFAASDTLFPVGTGSITPQPGSVVGSIVTAAPANTGGGATTPGGGSASGAGVTTPSAGGAATTKAPVVPTTTYPGYLVGSPYPFVLPPPDIPYFGSKWNGPWGYAVGHYQAFRGTGQYITHYSYYPLSYFGSLMAPFAYGVSGKK